MSVCLSVQNKISKFLNVRILGKCRLFIWPHNGKYTILVHVEQYLSIGILFRISPWLMKWYWKFNPTLLQWATSLQQICGKIFPWFLSFFLHHKTYSLENCSCCPYVCQSVTVYRRHCFFLFTPLVKRVPVCKTAHIVWTFIIREGSNFVVKLAIIAVFFSPQSVYIIWLAWHWLDKAFMITDIQNWFQNRQYCTPSGCYYLGFVLQFNV